MAGKHPNFGDANLGTGTATHLANANKLRPLFPGHREDKAYAEGRKNINLDGGTVFQNNPHPSGTPENGAFTNGQLCGFNSNGSQAGSVFHTGVPDRS